MAPVPRIAVLGAGHMVLAEPKSAADLLLTAKSRRAALARVPAGKARYASIATSPMGYLSSREPRLIGLAPEIRLYGVGGARNEEKTEKPGRVKKLTVRFLAFGVEACCPVLPGRFAQEAVPMDLVPGGIESKDPHFEPSQVKYESAVAAAEGLHGAIRASADSQSQSQRAVGALGRRR
jgi:hypothetical protein